MFHVKHLLYQPFAKQLYNYPAQSEGNNYKPFLQVQGSSSKYAPAYEGKSNLNCDDKCHNFNEAFIQVNVLQ